MGSDTDDAMGTPWLRVNGSEYFGKGPGMF